MSATRPKSALPVNNNGSAVLSCSVTAKFSKLDSGFQDPLTISSIATKNDNRLKAGIIVKINDSTPVNVIYA